MELDLNFEVDPNGIAYTYANGVKGTLNYMDVANIINEAKKLPVDNAAVYLETGSFLGCSSVIVASVTSANTLVYAHDIWSNSVLDDHRTGPPPKQEDDHFRIFYSNVKKTGFQKKIIPIRGDSRYTVDVIHDDGSVDLAFVDGDHSENGIYGDLTAVYPKMKEGGVILCHDCTQGSETLRGLLRFTTDFQMLPGTCGMVKIIKRTPHNEKDE